MPSPPKVVVKSILEAIFGGSAAADKDADDGAAGHEGGLSVCNSNGRSPARSRATCPSTAIRRSGYVAWICFANSSSAAVAGGESSFLTRRMFRGGRGQRRERRLWARVSASVRTGLEVLLKKKGSFELYRDSWDGSCLGERQERTDSGCKGRGVRVYGGRGSVSEATLFMVDALNMRDAIVMGGTL